MPSPRPKITLSQLDQLVRQTFKTLPLRVMTADTVSMKDQTAYARWEKGIYCIYVDPFQVNYTDGVIHELLHHVFKNKLYEWGNDLEEAWVMSMEVALRERRRKSFAATKWWAREIQTRLLP